MKRSYLNQGSSGPEYSKLQIADGIFVEQKGQLSFGVVAPKVPFYSVILDAEQVEDLRQFLNERAISKPAATPVPKVITES